MGFTRGGEKTELFFNDKFSHASLFERTSRNPSHRSLICFGIVGGIHKTVRRINNQQTVRQNWEKQMHQLGMAGHLFLFFSGLPGTS